MKSLGRSTKIRTRVMKLTIKLGVKYIIECLQEGNRQDLQTVYESDMSTKKLP